MTQRPRLLFVVGLAAVGVTTMLAVVAIVGLGGEEKSVGQAMPGQAAVTAKTDVTPRTHLFGDTLTARIDLVVDRDAVARQLPRIVRSFAPYAVERMTTVRRDAGRFSQLRYTFRLRCLREACLSTSGRARVRFPAVRVLYRSAAGESRVLRAAWPPVELYSRLASVPKDDQSASQSSSRLNSPVMPPWRADLTALPPVSDRWSPTLIVALLLLAGRSARPTRMRAHLPRAAVAGVAVLGVVARPPASHRACACSPRTRTNPG